MSCVSSLGQSSSEDLNSLCAESTDCRAKVFFFLIAFMLCINRCSKLSLKTIS